MTSSDMLPFAQRQHAHLRLAAALSPGQRLPRMSGFRQDPIYGDRRGHARQIRDQTLQVVGTQAARTSALGVEPELVLVLDCHRAIAPELLERAGLQVLEFSNDQALVAFASDPELTEFRQRCNSYERGPRGTTPAGHERPAEHQELFDSLAAVRDFAPTDALDPSLLAQVRTSDETAVRLRLDVHCWCPEDEQEARRRHEEVRTAVVNAGGRILDSSVRVHAGLSVHRVELPPDRVLEVAAVDRVRHIGMLPQPRLSYPQARYAKPEELPHALEPRPGSPIIAVIDSGVRSAHPLLATSVFAAEYVGAGLGDGGDGSGHGTLVASLALYGSLEELIAERQPLRPAGRLVSVRVLDDNDLFPDTSLWDKQLLEAMEVGRAAGARVFNLSLGDADKHYRGPRPTALAAVVDDFIRRNDVVVVVSAGNYAAGWTPEVLASGDYPRVLLESTDTGLADPASAALAITVGALCSDTSQGASAARETVDVLPVGGPGRPSPLSRTGPGAMGMVKPDLCAPGGSLSVDRLQGRVVKDDRTVHVLGAGGRQPELLLASDAGTSFAAPLVSHAALRVVARHPSLSANAVRALVLASVEPVEQVIGGLGRAADASQQRRLTGYGRVSAERAEASDDHRAVLLADATIVVDDVHLFAVPIPTTFFQPGGSRSLTVALAYDPPVRATRLDYLASRMSVQAFHGASVEAVRAAYMRLRQEDAADDEAEATPVELDKVKLGLEPTDVHRGRGAHQFGQKILHHRPDPKKGAEVIVAVRNTRRWDMPGAAQGYALAVVLERDEDRPALYAELRARLEALVEVELEAEM